MRDLVIDGTRIGDDTDCYVIAEIGHNHQGNTQTCLQLFDAAKWAGCNAVKLQKRENKTLYSEEFYNSPYNSENAFGRTYGEHREALEFDQERYRLLKCYAESIGLTFLATAFDAPSLKFIIELGCPAIKLASGDFENGELLEAARDSGRPVILSTGGVSSLDTIFEVMWTWDPGAVLHCTSGYPAAYSELNLRVIRSMCLYDGPVIGWSAHDTGIAMAPVAYALGARIIEKHFTLNRAWKGTDQAFSLEPQGMKAMVDNLKLCKEALGHGIKRRYDSEVAALSKQWKNERGQIDGKVSQGIRRRPKGMGPGNPPGISGREIHAQADRNEGGC